MHGMNNTKSSVAISRLVRPSGPFVYGSCYCVSSRPSTHIHGLSSCPDDGDDDDGDDDDYDYAH
jgi:hypothetical protein